MGEEKRFHGRVSRSGTRALGTPSSDLLHQAKALGAATIVEKPWKPQELLDLVQQVRTSRGDR